MRRTNWKQIHFTKQTNHKSVEELKEFDVLTVLSLYVMTTDSAQNKFICYSNVTLNIQSIQFFVLFCKYICC